MKDLRERLAVAFAQPGTWCEHPGGDSCEPWHRADTAIVAVAQWLRDEATQLADRYAGSAFPGEGVAPINLLEGLADSLTDGDESVAGRS